MNDVTPPPIRAERVASPEYSHPISSFTQAVRVKAGGDMLFFSGITARDANAHVLCPGDIEGQCHIVFQNIVKILHAAGAGTEDVVKTNAYVTHADYMEVYRRLKEQYLGKFGPPGTVVQVVALYNPKQLIEIELVAVVHPKELPA